MAFPDYVKIKAVQQKLRELIHKCNENDPGVYNFNKAYHELDMGLEVLFRYNKNHGGK